LVPAFSAASSFPFSSWTLSGSAAEFSGAPCSLAGASCCCAAGWFAGVVLPEFWACAKTAPPVASAAMTAAAVTMLLQRLVMVLPSSWSAKR
jgi:hypothetical protein